MKQAHRLLAACALAHGWVSFGIVWFEIGGQGRVQLGGKLQTDQFTFPVDAQAPGHHLAKGQYVQRGPLFRLPAEQVEFGGQFSLAAADIGVHALTVVVQSRNRCCVQGIQFHFRGAVKADDPAEAIDVQGDLSEQFGQAALRDATVLFHLPQTVLGVGKSLCPPQVRFGLGIDVGDAVLIA